MFGRSKTMCLCSIAAAILTVFSLSCISFADENNEEYIETDVLVDKEAAGYKAQSGWNDMKNGHWKYYEDGRYVTGWKKIDDQWYCFGVDEYMITGLYYDSIYNDTFLFGTDGVMLTGWQMFSGKWYYLMGNGRAVRGWKQLSGKWYFFNESDDPYMYRNQLLYISGDRYLLGPNGEMLTGWQFFNNNWYYLDRSSGLSLTGWQNIGGKWYYFYTSGDPYAVRGFLYNNSKWYFFDPESCAMCCKGWICTNNKYSSEGNKKEWCYFGNDGAAVTGWKTIDGWTYYFGDGKAEPYMNRGFIETDDARYYLGDNGALRRGWFTVDYTYYYAGSDGKIFDDGWKTINGKTYYFNDEGKMYVGLWTINDLLYDFGTDGICKNPPQDFDTYY